MWQTRLSSFLAGLLMGTGLFLLAAPEHWLPAFYHPVFFGLIALFSPVLIWLPSITLRARTPRRRELRETLRAAIATALLINILGELGLYQLYRYGFEYDKFAHFLVCMLFSGILVQILREWRRSSAWKSALVTFLGVSAAGFGWEVLEALSDVLFHTQAWGIYGTRLVADTVTDLAMNLLGTLAGIFVISLPQPSSAFTEKKPVARNGKRALDTSGETG